MAAGLAALVVLAIVWLYPRDHRPGLEPDSSLQVFRAKIKSEPRAAMGTGSIKMPAVQTAADADRAPETAPGMTYPAPSTLQKVTPQPGKTGRVPVEARPGAAAPSPPAVSRPVEPSHQNGGILHREKWLLSQNAANYTVQILGARSKSTLLQFIRENRLRGRSSLAYYRGRYKGRDWYRLLYGIFSTAHQARAVIRKLPASVRRASPWVRRLSSVQRDIRSF